MKSILCRLLISCSPHNNRVDGFAGKGGDMRSDHDIGLFSPARKINASLHEDSVRHASRLFMN